MRLMIQFATPQVMHAAWRRIDCERGLWPVVIGCRMPARVVRVFAARLRGLGLDLHDIPDGILVTAGSCDVEAMWRRARPTGRASGEARFAEAAGMLEHGRYMLARGRAAYAKGRRAREAAEVDASGLADFTP